MNDSQKFFHANRKRWLLPKNSLRPPFLSFRLETSFARLRGALHGYCAVYVDVYVTHLRL